MSLSVQLRITCKCSYNCICKIVPLIYAIFFPERSISWGVPCRQTIENWTQKVGYYQLEGNERSLQGEEVCVFIDESIRVGTERLLLVLYCPAWKCESRCLTVKYLTSDEGNNLKKAARLLGSVHVPDISHVMATCLRRVFSQDNDHNGFLAVVGKIQAKLSMGQDAYLRPPKQRAKARFLNQDRLLHWARCVFAKWGEIPEKVRKKLSPLLQHHSVLADLKQCLSLSGTIGNTFKSHGLSSGTLK